MSGDGFREESLRAGQWQRPPRWSPWTEIALVVGVVVSVYVLVVLVS